MSQLIRLLQLASPALPIGAYAYSEGLEYAAEAGWVTDEQGLFDWLEGRLRHAYARLDLPLYARLYDAWRAEDEAAAQHHSQWLLANRETREFTDADRAMGQALARLLSSLEISTAAPWQAADYCTYPATFALAAERWKIGREEGALAMSWAWAESQVAAALRLMAIGQTAGQRVLHRLSVPIAESAAFGLAIDEDEIGAGTTGLALASCGHEIQHTRLFRS